MRPVHQLAGLLLASLAAIVALGPEFQPVRATSATYQITDLGTMGRDSTKAADVNAAGQVVGAATCGDGALSQTLAFRFDATGVHDLGTLGGRGATALKVNGKGWVLG
jgi:probable HAF family extracellular repeat protein